MAPLAALIVFVVILVIIFGAYWGSILKPEAREERALRRRLKLSKAVLVGPAIVKTKDTLSNVGPLNTLLDRLEGTVGPLKKLIDRAGLKITVGTVLLSAIFLAVLAFFIVSQFSRSILFGLLAAPIAAALPFLYVRRKANKRLALFEEQFPEAMDLLARALRAGHALPSALKTTGEEIADPVGAEFRFMFEQQNFGMSLPDALKAMAERMPLLDAKFFVTAILTQREMGGNLSEVLDNLAHVIRERFKVKRQVRVVSAHGRITGVVLAFLPPSVAAILIVIAPQHIRLLIDDSMGRMMVFGAVILQIVGVLIIRKIVDVEY
jgi:tight adherence protein B